MRREFSKKTKEAGLERSQGRCEAVWDGVRCNVAFGERTPEYDHIVPATYDSPGSSGLDNLQVICPPCHRLKTKRDVAGISKADRIREKASGLRGNKRDWPKRPFGG